ncbi:MAG: putative bifunctional diguanylate cyclase/phosphodiesterase [Cellulosilyticaceae bacterium]
MNNMIFLLLVVLLGGGILGFYIYQCYALSTCHRHLNQCQEIDVMTKLPNRQALSRDFIKGHLLSKEQAIVILNIDSFKMMNDLMDEEEGNRLIMEISTRIGYCLSAQEGLYHFGGDMFAIYIKHVVSRWQIEELVQQLFEDFERPIILEKNQLFLNFCGGIAFSPSDGKDFESLVRVAELSMYVAKKKGPNHYEFFSSQLLAEVEKQSLLERELRHAIDYHEFTLVYQPKVDLDDYQVREYEALIRWQNHILGNVPPDLFIHRAEETGLIIPIGRWVFYESCMAIKRINEHTLVPKTIAINISAIEIIQENFVEQILRIIKGLEIPPNWIEIELTETIFLENKEMIIERLIALKAAGIHIAIDDFGKEYSALGYLIKLPIDQIKIDKVFIDTIGTKEEWIVTTLVDICHKMRCTVIAEGVETKEQLAFLKKAGCDKVQGYVFSKPLKEEQLLGLHFEL